VTDYRLINLYKLWIKEIKEEQKRITERYNYLNIEIKKYQNFIEELMEN